MNLKGKTILVQGAGRGNLGLVKTAKQYGVRIVMTGLGGDYPCNPYADKFCLADISDPDAVLKVAIDEKVDGAIICCSDTGLQAIGRCNDVLGLTGISEQAATFSSNKLLMKEKLLSVGVRTAMYRKVCSKFELDTVVKEIGFPMIVKATDLQGSRGINIVRDIDGLLPAFHDTMSLTKKDYCIIEQFIEGKEYGAQAFVYQGNILFVLPHGDETIMCKTAVPIGHYMPYVISEELLNDTVEQVSNSIKALGIDNSAVNVDLIEKDGKAYVVELTGRVGANCLPELTSNYYGINYYEMILSTALGVSPLPYWDTRKEPTPTLSRILQSNKEGVVIRVSTPKFYDDNIHLFINKGSVIRTFTNCNDAIGEVVVKGCSLDDCRDKLQRIIEQIKVEI